MAPVVEKREAGLPVVSTMHTSASDSDFEGSFSAATTEPSSPRAFLRMGSPTPKNARWTQVQERLLKFAEEGDADVERFGDIVASQVAIERFLHGSKQNLENAANQMREHFRWRREFGVADLIYEDFSDLEEHRELYWAGKDLDGVPTLTWILRKHDPHRTEPERFARFVVAQIERGLRREADYPNACFNIFVDLDGVGLGNNDGDMVKILQKSLVQNYPKIRKGLYVFPVNWLIALLWESIVKPLLSTLQPDINDKLSPLRGEYLPQLLEKYDISQIEQKFGGGLDLEAHVPEPIKPYTPKSISVLRREHESRLRSSAETRQAALTAQKLAKASSLGTRKFGDRRSEDSVARRRVVAVPGWMETQDSSSGDEDSTAVDALHSTSLKPESRGGVSHWRMSFAAAITAALSRVYGAGTVNLAACLAAGAAMYVALGRLTFRRGRTAEERDKKVILARLRLQAASDENAEEPLASGNQRPVGQLQEAPGRAMVAFARMCGV